MAIDITQYITLLEKGSVVLTKPLQDSENYVLVQKAFDPATGQEAAPFLLNLNKQTIQDQEDIFAQQEATITTARASLSKLLQDMEALQVPK